MGGFPLPRGPSWPEALVPGGPEGPAPVPAVPPAGWGRGWHQSRHGGTAGGVRGSGPPPAHASPPGGSPVFASTAPIPGGLQGQPRGPAPLSPPLSPARPAQHHSGHRLGPSSSKLCPGGQSPTVPPPVPGHLLPFPCQPGDSPAPALPRGPPLPSVPMYCRCQGQPHACRLPSCGTGCSPQHCRWPSAPQLGRVLVIILGGVLDFALVPG